MKEEDYNTHSFGTAARNRMLFQPASKIQTRGASKQNFENQRMMENIFVPFVKNEWGMPLKVKELENYLTKDGVQLVLHLLATNRIPNHEEQAVLMADYERYKQEHFEDVYLREHRIENAKQKCNVIVLFASEIMDDMLLELMWSLDKCKPISRFHKSIPIRKRITEFCHKTYRHARNKEMEKLVDKNYALDSSDRFKEQYIDPLWDKVKAYIDKTCRKFVADNEDVQRLLKKMGMPVETMVQFDQTCEYARVFLGMMKNVDKYLVAAGFPENFKLPLTYDSMLNPIDTLRQLGKLLFDNSLVPYEASVIEPLEIELLKMLFDDSAVAEASMPGVMESIEKQRTLYAELRAKHPDMKEDALYKEFYRIHPELSLEKKLAQRIANSYGESISKVDKPLSQKDKMAVWKNLCNTADAMLNPLLEEERILFKKCREQIVSLHPDYTEEQIADTIKDNLKIGLRLHPTASYDVLHTLLRLAMPTDMQEAIMHYEEKCCSKSPKRINAIP